MMAQEDPLLPNLQVLAVADLVLHEYGDPHRVVRLRERLQEEGVLKNPPIVTPLPETTRFIVLDGANRTIALRELGIPHVVAQVVRYEDPGVELHTWYHVVTGISQRAFLNALEGIPGLRLVASTAEEARAALANGDAAAYVVLQQGVYQIRNSDRERLANIRLLNEVVGTYKGKAHIFRVASDAYEELVRLYPDMTALVVFMRYRPADILALAREGGRVPSGVTRHIIPNRALRINIELSFLEADWPLERKRDWLARWLQERVAANAVRFYREPTFLFDE